MVVRPLVVSSPAQLQERQQKRQKLRVESGDERASGKVRRLKHLCLKCSFAEGPSSVPICTAAQQQEEEEEKVKEVINTEQNLLKNKLRYRR